jgi:hypothetical protein
MRALATAIWLAAACGRTPRATTLPPAPAAQPRVMTAEDPVPTTPRPDIDWAHVKLDTDDDVRGLWQRLAPNASTAVSFSAIPEPVAHRLARVLLHDGNFRCAPLGPVCPGVPQDLTAVRDQSDLTDPCFRRLLAEWAVDQLELDDFHALHDALAGILDIPPPDDELPSAVLTKAHELGLGFDEVTAMVQRAWKAGHRDVVRAVLADFAPDQLAQLYRAAHIDGVLDTLPASDYRDLFLAAIDDDQLATQTRASAISELIDGVATLPADLHTALVAATRGKDCSVAGVAALALARLGDHAYAPKWPRSPKLDVMMRSLCELTAYEHDQRSDEPSYLPGYIAPRGFTFTHTIYDPYVDPPDRRAVERVTPAQAILPELDDLVGAMRHCEGTVCRSDRREFRFGFSRGEGGLLLSSIEVVDLPPCVAP